MPRSDRTRNEPHPAKIINLVMIGIVRGRERTAEELAPLLTAARFAPTRVSPTHSMLAIAEAIPPT